MAFTESAVREALATVQDPDLKQDLITLNMIKDIEIKGEEIYFTVVLTTPACPLKEKIKQDCIDAVQAKNPGAKVFPHMSSNVTTVRQGPLLPGVRNIIAIASGKGGVGKSTVTSNLAVALAESGARVGIIDADISGPSIPTMFNCESARPGVVQKGEQHILVPVINHGVKLLSIGFLADPKDAIVWRGPMASSALRQFISDTDWGELDYLLIDLPPGTSDIHLTLVQTVPVTGAVVVTTPQKVALADAQKGVGMFQHPKINVPILGVVENMAYFTPEELPENKYYLFGKDGGKILAKRNDVPFLGEIPIVQGIREGGDNGEPIATQSDHPQAVAFREVAEELARRVALRNANEAKTEVVKFTR